MFKTFFNAIIIVIVFNEMQINVISANGDHPIVIRDDRVYRYVGNPSDDILLSDHTVEDTVVTQTSAEQGIPESLLIQMKDIKDASQFVKQYLHTEKNTDSNTNTDDIYLEYLQRGNSETSVLSLSEDRKKLSNLPRIASPAQCSPEMKMIELQTLKSHNEMYFPSCIKLPRCSGCCPSERLRCVPIKKSFEDFTVIKVKYSNSENKFAFKGFKVMRIEMHETCSCECIQKASHCSLEQKYVPEECRCICADNDKAKKCRNEFNKLWDSNKCECKCQTVSLCSTGFVFNNDTCKCVTDLPHNNTVNNSSDNYNYTQVNYTSISIADLSSLKYSKSEDRELQIQRNRGINIFQTRGINPETDNDEHN